MGRNELSADIVVVGGGLVGLATAACAARAGFHVVHLAPPAPPDRRTSALMRPSVAFLVENELVPAPESIGTALTGIRIIDATHRLIRAPETLFECTEAGLDAFGWNFANARLLAAFGAAASACDSYELSETRFAGAERAGNGYVIRRDKGMDLRCRLLVGCDGRNSLVRRVAGIGVRETRFRQSALVCDLSVERALDGVSVEFHYPNGPFTLVPAGEAQANLVWIDQRNVLEAVRDGSPQHFEAELNGRAQHLFGRITPESRTFIFPLSRLNAATAGANGVALAGEAAHAFPPIGAQGLNLGLRDVADLIEALRSIDRSNPGWADTVSADYARRRQGDLQRTGIAVDALFRSLLSDMLPAQALRAGGLWALKTMPNLRKKAFAAGMGVR